MHPLLRLAAPLVLAAPCSALPAVTNATPSGFLITHRAELKAAPNSVYDAIGLPSRWWDARHTYSGNAAALRMRLQAGGCFCELWERNSVEHGRVIYAAPGKAVRLAAALGPLQEMAVNGVLDFRIEPHDAGTKLTLTYRVRGSPDAALDKIAGGVDKVLGEQVQRLAAFVDAPAAAAKPLVLDEQTFDSGGTPVRFIDVGKGDPVILLHDAGATLRSQWVDTGIVRSVVDNFRAILVDARTPDDVLRLMDRLGIAKAHLVGYGRGAQLAAKIATEHPERLQTLVLSGATSLRAPAPGADNDLVVPDDRMIALTVPTLGIIGTHDPAMRDFIELKRVMPRFVRMVAIDGATHESAPASSDYNVALLYFLRYNPMR